MGTRENYFHVEDVAGGFMNVLKPLQKYLYLSFLTFLCALVWSEARAEDPDFTTGTLVCDSGSVTGQLTGNQDSQNAEVPIVFGTGSVVTFTFTGVNANGATTLLNAHLESGGTWSPTSSGEIPLTGQQTDDFMSTATAGGGVAIWHLERKNGTIDFEVTCTGGDFTAAMTVDKSADPTTYSAVGDIIEYSILVTNTGNLELTGITIDDPLTDDESCPSSTLAVGADMTCTSTYAITQEDIDNGSVSNTATVDSNETDPEDSLEVTVTAVQAASFTVEKTSEENEFDEVGDIINYNILVTNTGNVTLTGIDIDDALTDDESCPESELAPGDDMTCTATYEITQEDLDNGSVDNTAIVSTDEADDEEDSHTVLVAGSSAFTVNKIVDETEITELTTLNYTITVENTGNTPLTAVDVEDTVTQGATTLATPAATLDSGDTNTNDILDVGETWVYTVSYTVTEADAEDGGDIVNTASVSTDEAGPVEDSATTTLDIELGIDEDEVRETFMNVTRAFLARRIDRILSSDPEGYRIINRRGPGGGFAPRLSLNDSQGTKNASFGASLKGVRTASAQDSASGAWSAGGGNGNQGDQFDVWIEGEFSAYDDNLAMAARDGNFGIVYIGADYRVRERLLIGVLASFDWMGETSSVLKSDVSGNGWMVGPYLSAAIGQGFYFDGRIAWGKSSNTAKIEVLGLPFAGDFDTTRFLMRANLAGVIEKGALVITPHVGVAYMEEKQKAYTVFDGMHLVAVPGQTVALGRITVGPEFAYTIVGERGTTFVPFVRIDALWDFESAGLISLNGVVASSERVRAALELGFRVLTRDGISIGFAGKYDGIGAPNFEAWSASGFINFPF